MSIFELSRNAGRLFGPEIGGRRLVPPLPHGYPPLFYVIRKHTHTRTPSGSHSENVA